MADQIISSLLRLVMVVCPNLSVHLMGSVNPSHDADPRINPITSCLFIRSSLDRGIPIPSHIIDRHLCEWATSSLDQVPAMALSVLWSVIAHYDPTPSQTTTTITATFLLLDHNDAVLLDWFCHSIRNSVEDAVNRWPRANATALARCLVALVNVASGPRRPVLIRALDCVVDVLESIADGDAAVSAIIKVCIAMLGDSNADLLLPLVEKVTKHQLDLGMRRM